MKLYPELIKLCDLLNLPRIKLQRTKDKNYFIPSIMGFGTPAIGVQKGLKAKDELDILYHELGHYFKHHHKIPKKKFNKVFGESSLIGYFLNQGEYYLLSTFSPTDDFEYENDGTYVSPYAMVDPEEDWAECFVEALRLFQKGKKSRRKNKILRNKINFTIEMIKKYS